MFTLTLFAGVWVFLRVRKFLLKPTNPYVSSHNISDDVNTRNMVKFSLTNDDPRKGIDQQTQAKDKVTRSWWPWLLILLVL